MAADPQSLKTQLESLDYSGGLSRDQLREQVPGLPEDIYMFLPAAKKYYSAEDVFAQTGANALARAEGSFVDPDLDLPTDPELQGEPAGFGDSLSPGNHTIQGSGDYPGPADDIAGNSIQTSHGRGIPDEYD